MFVFCIFFWLIDQISCGTGHFTLVCSRWLLRWRCSCHVGVSKRQVADQPCSLMFVFTCFFLADQISCRSYVDSVYSMPSLADSLSYLLFICSFGRRRSNFCHQNERYLTFACYVFRTMFTSLPMQNLPRSCGVI